MSTPRKVGPNVQQKMKSLSRIAETRLKLQDFQSGGSECIVEIRGHYEHLNTAHSILKTFIASGQNTNPPQGSYQNINHRQNTYPNDNTQTPYQHISAQQVPYQNFSSQGSYQYGPLVWMFFYHNVLSVPLFAGLSSALTDAYRYFNLSYLSFFLSINEGNSSGVISGEELQNAMYFQSAGAWLTISRFLYRQMRLLIAGH